MEMKTLREWLEPILKILGGLIASVAIMAPMGMMVMDRGQEARQKLQQSEERLALQRGQQETMSVAQTVRQQEAAAAQAAAVARSRLLIDFWAPHREACMSGAAAASAVAASSARDRRALEAWGAAAAGPLASVPDAAVQSASRRFSGMLGCGRDCDPAALSAAATGIWQACGCVVCAGAPDLCGDACGAPAPAPAQGSTN